MDAYLPGKLQSFLADGGLDYLAERRGVVAVEWADRVRDKLSGDAVWLTLRPHRRGGVDGRLARLENVGAVVDRDGLSKTLAGW
jgi:tRNA A37 threonylcarbamoyladenosine biosynthesis protein TsaE